MSLFAYFIILDVDIKLFWYLVVKKAAERSSSQAYLNLIFPSSSQWSDVNLSSWSLVRSRVVHDPILQLALQKRLLAWQGVTNPNLSKVPLRRQKVSKTRSLPFCGIYYIVKRELRLPCVCVLCHCFHDLEPGFVFFSKCFNDIIVD